MHTIHTYFAILTKEKDEEWSKLYLWTTVYMFYLSLQIK